jgi:hypothetical protein
MVASDCAQPGVPTDLPRSYYATGCDMIQRKGEGRKMFTYSEDFEARQIFVLKPTWAPLYRQRREEC